MAMITEKEHEKVKERAERARNALQKAKEEGAKIANIGVRSLVSGGTAFAIGYAEGRAAAPADTEMFGIPLGLVAAGVGTLLNATGYAGDETTSSLVQAAADGDLAAYGYSKGKEMGVESKAA